MTFHRTLPHPLIFAVAPTPLIFDSRGVKVTKSDQLGVKLREAPVSMTIGMALSSAGLIRAKSEVPGD